ncbi:MAG: hypothetical protein A2010_14790 [Nitrospirae bacterium GWD2_57_9]|nr:MAG: hypothetical protein A2010_14790 [Nitrospirae bacterium GWD2_57_9]
MHYWKISSLKEEIRKGELTEKDRFLYALIYIILTAISVEAMALMPAENSNVWDVINSVSNIVVVTAGTIFAFKANGGSKGIDFLGRYFSISFVVAMRFLAISIPVVLMVLAYYSFAVPQDHDFNSTAYDTLPFVLWSAALYWRICVHIADMNKK